MALQKIAAIKEIPSGEGRAFDVAGRRIAVFNVDGTFRAIDDECPHQGGPLSEGLVNDSCVACPWHGAEFDLGTGKVLTPPAAEDVRSYQVVTSGNDLFVEIE